MKTPMVLAVVLAAAVSVPAGAETYDERFDNMNVQEIVDNEHILINYINCFLRRGPCTPEGKTFRETIPEAMETKCAKCTPKQKGLIRIFLRGVQTKQPALWEELRKQEDPEGKYKESVEEFLNASD